MLGAGLIRYVVRVDVVVLDANAVIDRAAASHAFRIFFRWLPVIFDLFFWVDHDNPRIVSSAASYLGMNSSRQSLRASVNRLGVTSTINVGKLGQ